MSPPINSEPPKDDKILRKEILYDKNGYRIDPDFETSENATNLGGDNDDLPSKSTSTRNVATYINILKQQDDVLQPTKHQRIKKQECYYRICSIRLSQPMLIYLNERSSKPSVYIRNLIMDDMAKNSKPVEYKNVEDLE